MALRIAPLAVVRARLIFVRTCLFFFFFFALSRVGLSQVLYLVSFLLSPASLFLYLFLFPHMLVSPFAPFAGQAQKQQNDRLSSNTMDMDQDEALSNFNDYNEILQSEVWVDLERLRLLARHGVPNQLRGVGCARAFSIPAQPLTLFSGSLEIPFGRPTGRSM